MTRRSFVAAVTLLLALTACDLTTGDPEPEKPAPKRGGTITVAITEPSTLDPSKAADRNPDAAFSVGPGLLIVAQICDPLVAFDPDTGEIEGLAAESWAYSEDVKKVTFKLRQGVKFHNGRDVTAEDYVFSISRFVHKDSGSSRRYWFQNVVGYQQAVDGSSPTISGVKALDPLTLEIELTEPFAELPAILSHPAAGSALPKEEVDKGAESFAANPVCTGPYALREPRTAGAPITLKRAQGYSLEHPFLAGGGAGYADEMIFALAPSLDDGYKLLDDGTADVAEVPLNEQLNNARRVDGRLSSGSNGHVSYVAFPVTKPPYDKADLRRAFALAIDREEIIEDLLAGSRLVPKGYLPPSAGSASSAACEETMPPSSRPEEAKGAFAAAGVDPAAVKPMIHFNDAGSGHGLWLVKVSEKWETHLGVDAELVPHQEELLRYLDFLAEGRQDGPFRLAWSVEYPSPEALLGSIFRGGSLDNFIGYASPEFDGMLNQARAATDAGERTGLYVQAAELLCRDLPALIMWFGASHVAFSDRVVAAGEERLDIFGYPRLRELGERS